ncbi:hypothetical protein [Legionella worsleiensis]|uniref:Uncharacterized protein n=1 Tax=Legionella worsleiensis TaxID=45076 RepID=A0A0W1A943_9GAMM|nr:hypothetical protein [Legionella worsleiensis]KTD77879.1 hypothetical protein Lwor_1761 [Legionella worsleiensis]STY33124.1 Uncharacterised protein [Legionella worsleiensis]
MSIKKSSKTVDNVNAFFKPVHQLIGHIATYPYTGWSVTDFVPRNRILEGNREFGLQIIPDEYIVQATDIGLKMWFSPVLLPATFMTLAIAVTAEVIAVTAHLLSLTIANLVDLVSNDSDAELEKSLTPVK